MISIIEKKHDLFRYLSLNYIICAQRQYLIQIMAFGKSGKQLGVSEKLAKTNLRCYTCNSKNKNSKCNKKSNIQNCPTGMVNYLFS